MHIPFVTMTQQITHMSNDEIIHHLHILGCPYDEKTIDDKLLHTYNDLSIADEIFKTFPIDDQNSIFEKSFIDEAILEFAKRNSFPFTHYGILSIQAQDLLQNLQPFPYKQAREILEKLMQLAKYFKCTSLEGMMYQVNDGMDFIGFIAMILDHMMQEILNNQMKPKEVINLTTHILKTFPESSNLFANMLYYEQASAYILMKSSKGDRIFLDLIANAKEIDDIVFHYGLAYLEKQPKKAIRIYRQYLPKCNEESEAYQMIQDIIKEYSNS